MKKAKSLRRIFCTALAALTLGSTFPFASCGSVSFTDLAIPEGGYDGSKITVKFSHTMGQNLSDVLDQYIAKFNKLYPNITIEWTQVGNYDDVRDQISKELRAGNQPNMAYCYPDHVALYNITGGVQPLDDLIASEIELTREDGSTEILGLTEKQQSDFIQGYYEEGRAFGDGKMYTLPFSKSTEVLYYDKTYFEENQRLYANEYIVDENGDFVLDKDGQKQESPGYQNENYNLFVPTTWDQLETVCKRLKALDPNCIPLGYDSEANWFINMCMQYGSPYTSSKEGEYFLFNNETNWNFVARFREWYQKGYVTTQEILGAYTSSLFTEQTSATRSYMSIGSSAGATKQRPTPDDKGIYPFEVGIASIPQVNPEKPQVISQGPSICIFKKDNPQEVIATWLFAKYLTTSIEFQSDFSIVSGYVPVLTTVIEDPYYASFLKKANGTTFVAALSAKTCMNQVDAYFVSPAFKGSSVARDQVGALMQACFTADKNLTGDAAMNYIKNAFSDAVEECEYQA